jgi:DNA-binding CsgD family transcriptional regulator
MTAGRIEQLTEAQRACLRLVLSHHNSKEIAAIVGVSPSAIDKRIERAVQILGVGSRFEAARRLQDHESAVTAVATCERLPSEPIDVPTAPFSAAENAATEPWGLVRRFIGIHPSSGSEGVARNRLSKGSRLVRLIGLTVMIAIASMAIVNMAMTLTSLFRSSRVAVAPLRGAATAARTVGE